MYTTREQAVTLDYRGIHKGITAKAKKYGVTYTHLYLVLTGKRSSKSLIEKIAKDDPYLLEMYQ